MHSVSGSACRAQRTGVLRSLRWQLWGTTHVCLRATRRASCTCGTFRGTALAELSRCRHRCCTAGERTSTASSHSSTRRTTRSSSPHRPTARCGSGLSKVPSRFRCLSLVLQHFSRALLRDTLAGSAIDPLCFVPFFVRVYIIFVL